jgi:hypothetical protein
MSYDIDIYDEISLSYLVYLDKEYYFNNFKENSSVQVKVPLPEYELLIQLNHSIFEHLYTLLHFYIFVTLLSNINVTKLKESAKVTQSNKILSYTALLTFFIINKTKLCVEKKQLYTLENLIDKELLLNVNELPYRFTLAQISQVLLEKAKNFKYLHHMLNFMLMFLHPKQINHVVEQVVIRRIRQSY